MEGIKLYSKFIYSFFKLIIYQSKPGEVKQAVIDAINAGYTHIDCAMAYGNETEVGEALKEKFADGTISRKDIFITSKVNQAYLNIVYII